MSEMISLNRRGPWKKSVKIKQYLGDGSDESIQSAARGIVGAFRKTNVRDEYLNEILEQIQDCAEEPDLDEFNGLLDELYDWADDNRVWLG